MTTKKNILEIHSKFGLVFLSLWFWLLWQSVFEVIAGIWGLLK